jgi:hypothetical protein
MHEQHELPWFQQSINTWMTWYKFNKKHRYYITLIIRRSFNDAISATEVKLDWKDTDCKRRTVKIRGSIFQVETEGNHQYRRYSNGISEDKHIKTLRTEQFRSEAGSFKINLRAKRIIRSACNNPFKHKLTVTFHVLKAASKAVTCLLGCFEGAYSLLHQGDKSRVQVSLWLTAGGRKYLWNIALLAYYYRSLSSSLFKKLTII